ncbi:hypothetical protein F3Y22_tig00003840pilonHSYRG00012 [Hibiscus syriacus]|uniref:Glycosyltransferases n=1 Tax=Hibiscus syriacus TaxID=106335 RepID=A0A6A3CNH7_HIBSY|nr:hypothetical protein F3Y22_tig00003840pilonHSYRG00012 [Hibiscus syriacus]
MASIRRTLSPAFHSRSYQNGAGGFSSSLRNKLFHNGNAKHFPSSTPSKLLFSAVNYFTVEDGGGLFSIVFFFLIGLLFGIVPLGHMETDFRPEDLAPPDLGLPHVDLQSEDPIVSYVALGVNTRLEEQKEVADSIEPLKQLIVVTPTYNRAFQAYFLNRLGQVLRLVKPPLVWIVVEEKTVSLETAEILRKNGVMYRHVVSTRNSTNVKDRGVHQRNAALEHIERHKLDGIVFFADDDNVYTLELFESLRTISRFGTWPVAMLERSKNKAILEGSVCNASRHHLVGPKAMVTPLLKLNSTIGHSEGGFPSMNHIETTFIEQVVEDESQMEVLPGGALVKLIPSRFAAIIAIQ